MSETTYDLLSILLGFQITKRGRITVKVRYIWVFLGHCNIHVLILNFERSTGFNVTIFNILHFVFNYLFYIPPNPGKRWHDNILATGLPRTPQINIVTHYRTGLDPFQNLYEAQTAWWFAKALLKMPSSHVVVLMWHE